MKGLNLKSRIILLIAAGVLLLIAIIWSFFTNETGELSRIARIINSYGYDIDIGDIYPADTQDDATIEEMLEGEYLSDIVSKSREAGFPSDTMRRGDIVQLLIALDDYKVITLFMVDGDIELAFIQIPGEDQVLRLGE